MNAVAESFRRVAIDVSLRLVKGKMPFLILLLFIGVPIAEIALFIEIGGEIGLGWTLAAIFGTAAIGTWLVRQQGLQTLSRAQAAMAENRLPVGEMITGVCILVAGALLLTPGFLTDALGFALLIPPLRAGIAAGALARMKNSRRFQMHMAGRAHNRPPGQQGDVIDGEFEDVTPQPMANEGPMTNEGPPNPDSPWSRIDGPEGKS